MKSTHFNECFNKAEKIDNEKWDNLIKKCFDDCKVIWKSDMISQKDFGSDGLIITKDGRKYSFDKKVRSPEYFEKTWLLEIVHHQYTNELKECKIETIPGWLYKSTSDLILYGTANTEYDNLKELCIFSLIPFKTVEFKNIITNLKQIWANTFFNNGTYQMTLCKMISNNLLEKHCQFFWYWKSGNIIGNIDRWI